jgi:amidase
VSTVLDDSHFLDATAQAALVASGEASAEELVRLAIARIERLNPPLNALASRRFDKALDEARQIDRTPKSERGPFAGVPMLVKDIGALGGEPNTLGCRLFEDYIAPRDDAWVRTLRAAGLVPLGKTTTPELGLVCTTESLLLGETRNPWREGLSPGGSSGGSAAAVSTGMVSVATASDGGGSIRIPAAATGLFGLKPSRNRAIMPARNLPGDVAVTFAYGRSVRDSDGLLAMAEAARVRRSGPSGLPAMERVGPGPVRPMRIALMLPTLFGTPPEPEVERAILDAAALLESLGHHVEEVPPPVDGEVLMDHFVYLWASSADFLCRNFPLIRPLIRGPNPLKWPRYEDAFEPFTRDLAAYFRAQEALNPGFVKRALAFMGEAEHRWRQFFQTFDLVLTPVLRRPWFGLGELDTRLPFETLRERLLDNASYTPQQNYTGQPAMSVPLGTTDDGLPIGVHIVAPMFHEPRLLRLAYQLEEAAPWADRRPPSPESNP